VSERTVPAPYSTGRSWQDALALLREAERVALFGHLGPDMDVIGSMLALMHALRAMGKQAVACSHDPVPHRLAILPGAEEIVTCEQQLRAAHTVIGGWDLLVTVDGHGAERFGGLYALARRLAPRAVTLNIDHHVTNNGHFCDVEVVDSRAAATAEIVYFLLRDLGAPPSPLVATCLLAGLYTDTLSFQTSSVTERTFAAAAGTLAWGADAGALAFMLFRSRSVAMVRLWALVLSSLHYEEDSDILWADVTRDMIKACGAEEEDLSGISSFLGGVQDAKVIVLFKEMPDGTIQISFRSQTVDVAALASGLGGGGHRRAAGCTLPGPLQEARRTVLDAARRLVWNSTANGMERPVTSSTATST
jgi:phosphoesterase RecJ-like protein